MATGTRYKHIRKPGAFASGELSAGQIGVNTADKRLEYSPDGTGVFRALNDDAPLLARFVTPETHGAVGNGTTDDTAAIQACFAAAASKKAIVSFKPGATYKCSASLTYPSGLVQIEGNGAKLEFTANNFDLLSLGPKGFSEPQRTRGYVRNLLVWGPGGDDANAQPPNNGKAGIVWNSTRHARTIDCEVNNVDIGFDLRGNCYAHKFLECRTLSTNNVGILLRGGAALTAGSGSDIEVRAFWGGGHKAAFWGEGGAGGYWFNNCKPGGGWQNAPAPIDAYGVWVFAPTYDAQTTVTAAVAVNASTIQVADASKIFTNEIVINGQEIEILSKSGNTLTVATSASGGSQQNYRVRTAIPAGSGIQVTSGLGNVSIKGGGIEGTHDMHAIRMYRDVVGFDIDGFSFNSNGSGGVNQMIQVIKHTGEGSASITMKGCMVQGNWTGATPITMATRWKDANQFIEIGTTHDPSIVPTFAGTSMNLIDRPMVSWSQVKGARAIGKNFDYLGGRAVRISAAGALEVSTDATMSAWAAVGGTAAPSGGLHTALPARLQDAPYTVVLADAGKMLQYNAENTPGTYTLPNNAPPGTLITLAQVWTGTLTVRKAAADVAIRKIGGTAASVNLAGENTIVQFVKGNDDRWIAMPFGNSLA